MTAKLGLTRIFTGGLVGALLAFACSDDTNGGNVPEEAGTGGSNGGSSSGGKAGSGGASTGGKATGGTNPGGGSSGTAGKGGAGTGGSTPDGGDGGAVEISLCAGKTGTAQIECGQYIVEHIDACGDCHTPRLQTGLPDTTKILAGSPSFADIDPAVGVGNIPAPNLTQLKANKWTVDDVVTAIRDGKAKGGVGLFPAMPYVTFHNMATVDAEAIAAFILQLDPIDNPAVKDREPLPTPLKNAFPVKPVDVTLIPDPIIAKTDASYSDALLGKYLAAQLGVCLDCHTSRLPNSEVDMSKAFAGGQPFELGAPFGTVYSENITPATDTGLKNWTPGLVKNLIKTGKTDTGDSICPPMPVGPNGAFGGMTDAHALAIGAYITHLPPIENGTDGGMFPMCLLPPGPPPGDAGPDASSKDSGTD